MKLVLFAWIFHAFFSFLFTFWSPFDECIHGGNVWGGCNSNDDDDVDFQTDQKQNGLCSNAPHVIHYMAHRKSLLLLLLIYIQQTAASRMWSAIALGLNIPVWKVAKLLVRDVAEIGRDEVFHGINGWPGRLCDDIRLILQSKFQLVLRVFPKAVESCLLIPQGALTISALRHPRELTYSQFVTIALQYEMH